MLNITLQLNMKLQLMIRKKDNNKPTIPELCPENDIENKNIVFIESEIR